MNNYWNNLNEEVKEYFNILSPEFPEWLYEYIDIPEVTRLDGIGQSNGTIYSKVFNDKYYYSSLTHSIGVSLLIWHFTHDKKQALSGLLHDIATPVFKHCIDFMNGDSEHQESTEERTEQIIKNSKGIMNLLERDNIKVSEVSDYKIYPIADNDTPKLSADRFEYTLSGGLYQVRVFDLEKIKQYYNNITIVKNEDGLDELAFKDKDICEEYIHTISKLWPEWISDRDRTVMQFLADMCKSMKNAGYLSISDLYTLSEKEVIEKFINCEDSYLQESFKNFLNADTVYKSDYYIDNKYCVNINSKKRYIIPLVLTKNGVSRINTMSESVNNDIENFLNLKRSGYYTYFGFDFKPYDEPIKKLIR